MTLGCKLAVAVLVVLTAASTTNAHKPNFSMETRSLFAIAAPFGFSADGRVALSISNLPVWHAVNSSSHSSPDPDVKRMGFFIARSKAQMLLESAVSQGECALDAKNTVKLITMDTVTTNMDRPNVDRFIYHPWLKEVIVDFSGGEFTVFFANCNPLLAVTMDLRTELYNVKPDGKPDYQSIDFSDEDAQPTTFLASIEANTVVAFFLRMFGA